MFLAAKVSQTLGKKDVKEHTHTREIRELRNDDGNDKATNQ